MSTGESKRPSLTSGSQNGAAASTAGKTAPARILADMEQHQPARLRAALRRWPWLLACLLGVGVLAGGYLYFADRSIPPARIEGQGEASAAGDAPATSGHPRPTADGGPATDNNPAAVEPDWSSIPIAGEPAVGRPGKAASSKSTPGKPALEKPALEKPALEKPAPMKAPADKSAASKAGPGKAGAVTAPASKPSSKPGTAQTPAKAASGASKPSASSSKTTRPAKSAEPTPTAASVPEPVSPPVIATVPDTPPRALSAPQPHYPSAAQRRGDSGTVLLRVQVAADGNVVAVAVARSSNSRDLDRAASEAAGRWRFRPATHNGRPVAGSVQVPISFNISN